MKKNERKSIGASIASRGAQDGYSLVEIMVAAIVMSIAFIALFAIIRSGRAIDIEELHRRRARAVIDSCFETAGLSYTNYSDLADEQVADAEVEIDPANPTVGGTLDIFVGEETTVTASADTDIAFKPVTVTVTWSESGTDKSISITKRISEL
jgi:type II secretory pathway pseudopilin PulG